MQALPTVSQSIFYGNQAANRKSPLVGEKLVGMWTVLPKDSGGAKLFDRSGYANHGTLTNGPTWSPLSHPGGFGSLAFDGTDDYVSIADNASLDFGATESFTLGCMMRTISEPFDINGNLLTKGSADSGNAGYELFRRRSGAASNPNGCHFFITDGATGIDAQGPTTIADGLDHFCVGVCDRIAQLLYVYRDGVLDVTSADISGVGSLANANVLALGSSSVSTRFANVLLNNAFIIRRAMTASEIAALYRDLLTGSQRTLRRLPRVTWFVPAAAPGGIVGPLVDNGHLMNGGPLVRGRLVA